MFCSVIWYEFMVLTHSFCDNFLLYLILFVLIILILLIYFLILPILNIIWIYNIIINLNFALSFEEWRSFVILMLTIRFSNTYIFVQILIKYVRDLLGADVLLFTLVYIMLNLNGIIFHPKQCANVTKS